MTDSDRMVVWLREAMDVAQHDAEAATPGPWTVRGLGRHDQAAIVPDTGARSPAGFPTGPAFMDAQGSRATADARHAARHDPAAVLRRIAADRQLLDDLLAEPHTVVCDPFYTCEAATEERDGGVNPTTEGKRPCDCGLAERVERRVRLLAEGWGWTEETTC